MLRSISMRTAAVSVSLFVLVRTLSAAGYTPTWVPTGLGPGDTYHLVFTTSTTTNATSGAIGDYDAIADARGDTMSGSPYGDVTWYCLGATAADSPVSRGLVSAPVYRLDDTLVATGAADMWDGSLLDDLGLTETGVDPPLVSGTDYVWTGTSSAGIPHNSPMGGVSASGGRWGSMDNTWTEYFVWSPAVGLPVYGISEQLQVPVIPEPGTLFLAVLSVAAGGTTLRRRRGRNRGRE